MKEIKVGILKGDVQIRVPGSKSDTHRALIAAALSDGKCRLTRVLDSEDTRLTRQALVQLGAVMSASEDGLIVEGTGGVLKPCSAPICLGNSGTSMRLLTAVAALGVGEYILCGTERMHQRPIGDLLDGLSQIGAVAKAEAAGRCPPVRVQGGRPEGGRVILDCSVSSQFLSALLLIGPYTRNGIDVSISKGPVSRPYIDMTVRVMTRFGVSVERQEYRRFHVSGGQVYRSRDYGIEPDASQAGYFWAAAAVTGRRVKVSGIAGDSIQGDARFPEVLEKMGCRVSREPDGITVQGGPLVGIQTDMGDMPDLVPTLAVVAAFAEGETLIGNVSHLRAKESDRLAAVSTELKKMGVTAEATKDALLVRGGRPKAAVIETYDDHRMAMSFAVAGLKVPGIAIENERCVDKSFPDFWEVFGQLYE
jgi:3-phosphoshikimate 1-carboxyvinyltransferase